MKALTNDLVKFSRDRPFRSSYNFYSLNIFENYVIYVVLTN